MFGDQQFRTNKRARSPDNDEHPQQYQRGRNYNRGPPAIGGHPFQKRPRSDTYQPTTIEEKIANLGVSNCLKEIGSLAKSIDEYIGPKAAGHEIYQKIAAEICKCIISFPTHTTSYATLVGITGSKYYDIACKVVNCLQASYSAYFEAQKWQDALTIMYALSSLVNCNILKPSAMIEQFKMFLEAACQDNIPQSRADYLVYTVVSSLPYVVNKLAEEETTASFEELMSSIDGYLERRSKSHLNVTRIWLSSDSTIQMDYLESLWVQTKNFRANNWMETFLSRPYAEIDYKGIITSSLVPKDSIINAIPMHSPEYVYPCPRIVFRLYEDDIIEDGKTMPGPDKIERFCIENHVRNIIDEIANDKIDCSKQLKAMHRSGSLPMKHLLIEVILGELLTLPKPKHNPLIYHALIAELAKRYPTQPGANTEDLKNTFDFILNQGIKVLFENMETMNVTCVERFMDWLSFYLNNASFVFPWKMWSDATVRSKDSPKATFVREMLTRIMRFSFHKKINALVGEHLGDLMPPEPEIIYSPVFKDNPKAEELASDIRKLIAHKASDQEFCQALNIVIEGVKMPDDFVLKEDKFADRLLRIDIFVSVILSIAAKSLTHLSSAIGKFRNMIRALIAIESGQVQLLQTLSSCMAAHTQAQVILIDKLIKADLIQIKEVCDWLFSDQMKSQHLSSYPWEILNNTLNRMAMAIVTVRREIKNKPKVTKTDADGDIEMKSGDDEATNGDASEQSSEKKDNKPTAHEINEAELEAKLKSLSDEFFGTVTVIISAFSNALGDHIRKCEANKTSYLDEWFRWVTGQMQRIYYNHYDVLQPRYDEIKAIVERIPSIGSSIIDLNI